MSLSRDAQTAQSEFTTLEQLYSALAAENTSLIGIDGWPGAGKSTLADRLSERLGVRVVHLDSLLDMNRGAFTPNIRYSELERELKHRPLIVEGVCLLEVLSRAAAEPDVLIYVKKFDAHGVWVDEEDCELIEPLDPALERVRSVAGLFAKFDAAIEARSLSSDEEPSLPLTEECLTYHAKYRPTVRATCFYRVVHE